MKQKQKNTRSEPCSVEGCEHAAMKSLPRLEMCAKHVLWAYRRATEGANLED